MKFSSLMPIFLNSVSGAGSVSATGSSDNEETSKLKKMKPHVPGIVIFADHNRPLPWTVTYHAVTLFADVSGISIYPKYIIH